MLVNTKKIQGRLRELGYTQAEVAKMIGISSVTFSYRMQDGDFRASQLNDLFKVLEVTDPENYLLLKKDN